MMSLQELRDRAERYRRLAETITDSQALQALHDLAARYEAMAAELGEAGPCSSPNTGLA